MADWRLDQKTEETPQSTDLSMLVRGTSVFKTTFQKIKEFVIGTTSMGTTATDVTGAVKEINDKVGIIDVENDGDIASQLNDITQNISKLQTSKPGYEEGSWIPIIYGNTIEGNPTYSTQNGKYIKIGNLVYISCDIVITNKGNITGTLNIGGLPFAPKWGASGTIGYSSGVTSNNGLGLQVHTAGQLRIMNGIGNNLTSDNIQDSTNLLGISAIYKC